MSNITDKELLAITDLLNLRFESATIGKEVRRDGTIEEHHTIYTFLKAQYEWLKLLEEAEITSDPLLTYPDPNDPNPRSDAILMQKYEKFQNEYKDETIGGFYHNIYTDKTKKEIKEKKFPYFDKTIMRKNAPIIMEYFDRYDVSDNKSEHEGHFLDEWNIA